MYDKIQKILKRAPDPLKVRVSTAQLLKASQFVWIDLNEISKITKVIGEMIGKKKLLTSLQFGKKQNCPQKVFFMDCINFCFWPKKGEKRWEVEYPRGKVKQGWFGLAACWDRAMEEGLPVLEADFWQKATLPQLKKILRSNNSVEIPLLKEKYEILKETAGILKSKFGGEVINLVGFGVFQAGKIAKLIIKNFKSFQDYSPYKGRKIFFYKRAQICVYDLSFFTNINKINELTIFADYKIPQILRSLKVIIYAKKLAHQIDMKKLIKKDSLEELEIRAASIWSGELIAHNLKVEPALVDNALWFLASLSKKKLKPHHQTRTIFY